MSDFWTSVLRPWDWGGAGVDPRFLIQEKRKTWHPELSRKSGVLIIYNENKRCIQIITFRMHFAFDFLSRGATAMITIAIPPKNYEGCICNAELVN
eukprot:981086-Amphidinium_carterae.1